MFSNGHMAELKFLVQRRKSEEVWGLLTASHRETNHKLQEYLLFHSRRSLEVGSQVG